MPEALDDIEGMPIKELDRAGAAERLRQLQVLEAQLDEAWLRLITAWVREAAKGCPGFKEV